MIGLIVSVIVWYVLKGDTVLLKETTNINEKLTERDIEFSPATNKPEKWWREQYSKKGNFEKSRNHGFSEGVKQNNVQVGRHTFKRLNCKGWKRGLEECRVLCELRMATRRVHKSLTQIACALNKPQGQGYRFLQTTNQVTYNAGNKNIHDLSAMLLTMVIIVLAGLLLNYRGLWKLKCQIVGTLIMIGIPPSRGTLQWPRVESSREVKCPTGTEHYDAIMAGLICALIGALIVCVCLGRGLKTARKYKRTDGIYLQIVTERLSETAYLGECLMPIDQVFQGSKVEPLIRELYVKHICGTYLLQLVWGRPLFFYAIEAVATGQAIDLTLPGSVNISKRMADALKRRSVGNAHGEVD